MDYIDKINQLPPDIQHYLLASAGVDLLIDLCDEYEFPIKKISATTEILTRAFVGELAIDKIFDEVKTKLEMNDSVAREFTNKLLMKRFLVADEFFGGKVSEYLKAQEIDLSTTEQEITEYKKAVDLEYNPPETVEQSEPGKQDDDREEEEEFDPAKSRAEMLNIFKEYVMTLLSPENTLMRIDLNAILVALLATDESFQLELINVLSANAEHVTAEKITLRGEALEPTVGNWLRDFVSSAQTNERGEINSLSKAKYLSQNENIRKVTPEERQTLNSLFELYENLKNFYQNKFRLPIEELQVLGYSEEEMKLFQQAKLNPNASGSDTSDGSSPEEPKKDIYSMYLGEQDDREALSRAVEIAEAATGRDAVKLSNWLYDEIVARHRFNVIAGIKLAIEVGLIDNFVSQDRRYIELLEAHYKRNNREPELKAYQQQRFSLVHVKNFIKYLLMERLGMPENNAGRLAVQLSNIYRAQGVKELSQLAYFDVKSQQFKWI